MALKFTFQSYSKSNLTDLDSHIYDFPLEGGSNICYNLIPLWDNHLKSDWSWTYTIQHDLRPIQQYGLTPHLWLCIGAQ